MRSVAIALCLLGVGLGSSCAPDNPEFSPRNYEITISIDTPNGEARASGVVEARGERGRGYVRGEAIPIDLPDGRTLFMLIYSPFKNTWEFQEPWVPRSDIARVERGETVEMLPASRQDLVIFEDIARKETVKKIPYDDPSSVLGPGYRIKGMWVSKTVKPVTVGILERLPWLRTMKGNVLGTGSMDIRYETNINRMSFARSG